VQSTRTTRVIQSRASDSVESITENVSTRRIERATINVFRPGFKARDAPAKSEDATLPVRMNLAIYDIRARTVYKQQIRLSPARGYARYFRNSDSIRSLAR